MKCPICSKDMNIYVEADYDFNKVGSYGFASRKNPEYMHYRLYECAQCRILVADAPLEKGELDEAYRNADFDSKQEAYCAAGTYVKYLRKYRPEIFGRKGVSVLDIGTGEGSYLKIMKDEGIESVKGVEPSKIAVENADVSVRESICVIPFFADDFQNERFDVVSLFQTIEHIPDPCRLISDMKALLSEGGVVYMVCHDYSSPVNRIMGLKSPIYDIEHLQLFSRKSIRLMAEKSGLKNIRVFTIKNTYPLKYWVRLFPFPSRLKSRIIKFLSKTFLGEIMISINVGNVGIIAGR